MNSVPKLIPFWPDVAIQDVLKQKRKLRYASYKFPDYGGVGVDILSDRDLYKSEIFKHSVDQTQFAANICALPFLPPNKVEHVYDVSLESKKVNGSEYKEFCSKLEVLRRIVNTRGREKFRNEISACYKKVKKASKTSKYKKVLVPEHVIQLAEIYPEHGALLDINFSYAGSCLAVSNISNKPCLLHSSGGKLDKLCVIPLQESCDSVKHFSPFFSEQKIIELGEGKVLQISSSVAGTCYVRKKNKLYFVNFDNPPDQSCENRRENGILSIAASPYNPIEVLSVYEKGRLKLKNIELKKIIWKTDDQFVKDSAWKCSYGSHPQSALCLNKKKVYIYDLRMKERMKKELFNTRHASCYRGEELVNLEKLENPFQHIIASDRHLFICDERYPNNPVMAWSHMLKNFPLYCNAATYTNNENSASTVVVLGTQGSSELAAFFIESFQEQIHPVSLGPPLLLSSATDCIDSLKLHCLNIDEYIMKRFSQPLAGICLVPHYHKTGFTAFHLTSLGDLFYQDFRKILSTNTERTYRTDIGCMLPTPEMILPHLRNWFENTDAVISEEKFRDDFLTQINVDLKDILSLPEEISSTCVSCRCNNIYSKSKLVASEFCPTCGLNNLQSQELCKAFTNLSLQVGPLQESSLLNYDNNTLLQFHDPFSRKILEPWIISNDSNTSNDVDEQSKVCDFNLDANIESPSSVLISSAVNMNKSDMHSLTTDSLSLLENQGLTISDSLEYSHDYSEEFVVSSQEVRPLIGETLRTPSKSKVYSIKSKAGF